jgi:hypothetical protein
MSDNELRDPAEAIVTAIVGVVSVLILVGGLAWVGYTIAPLVQTFWPLN